jgi:hypothetical protein
MLFFFLFILYYYLPFLDENKKNIARQICI